MTVTSPGSDAHMETAKFEPEGWRPSLWHRQRSLALSCNAQRCRQCCFTQQAVGKATAPLGRIIHHVAISPEDRTASPTRPCVLSTSAEVSVTHSLAEPTPLTLKPVRSLGHVTCCRTSILTERMHDGRMCGGPPQEDDRRGEGDMVRSVRGFGNILING